MIAAVELDTSKQELARDTFRICPDIDLYTLDRGCGSCVHATPFCRKTCYKLKYYKMYPKAMRKRDRRNERMWDALTAERFAAWAATRRYEVDRFRWCTRGEPFATIDDVFKLRDVMQANASTDFWLPTRGWHNPQLRRPIVNMIRPLPNAFVMASVDPSDAPWKVRSLEDGGWSTMFYGDDSNDGRRGRVLCPKTWFKDSGLTCATCGICWTKEQTHLHLKQHT